MLRLLCTVTLVLFTHAAQADPSGPIRVVDGDTFEVGHEKVRLHAIDAPETDQLCGSANSPSWACGDWVRRETRALYDGKHATCRAVDTDRYGRTVAKCTVAGEDVGARLVGDGLAFAYRRYGMDYDLIEKGAAVNGRGLHATGVVSPAAFRSTKRAQARPARDTSNPSAKTVTVNSGTSSRRSWLPKVVDPACNIKGNISRYGDKRIYHVPGQAYYDKTRISMGEGERWFCSEAEARAAGWRKARK